MPKHDLAVIGAGPGGYVAAIRAAQLGLNVACIEKEAIPGGTCLRVGCIPSKALLESSERFHEARHDFAKHGILCNPKLDLTAMLKRKDGIVKTLAKGIEGLFKKNKIAVYAGTATILAPGKIVVQGTATINLEATNILIATGSQPASLPGIEWDGVHIGGSTEALSYERVPESLIVIGAGAIGLELGSVWQRLGSRVTVLEYLDRILPGMDRELANEAFKLFKRQGLDFKLATRVTGARVVDKRVVVSLADAEPLQAERVLVSVGRKPNTEGLGLQQLGIELERRGTIPVDRTYQTSIPGIYAIGDVISGPMLAHKAEEEGIACIEGIVTGYGHVNYQTIPSVVYTHPEAAGVGQTEEQLKESGRAYRKGNFAFRGNGRAHSIESCDGFVKILADAASDRILGVHILGPRAGDLIAEAAVAMEFGASSEDLARCCHAHPTLAEALKEAALAVDGRAIHA